MAAGYDPNKIILIDKNLAEYVGSSKFPNSCQQIDCKVCCGGVPPSCSDEKLTCNFQETPTFTSLLNLLGFLAGFFLGNYLLVILNNA